MITIREDDVLWFTETALTDLRKVSLLPLQIDRIKEYLGSRDA